MSGTGRVVLVATAILAAVAAIAFLGQRGPAEAPRAEAAAPAPYPVRLITDEIPGYARDPDQRSLAIYEFRKAAASGAERGREIFYYKCWFCHNEYAGEQSAPKLEGVFSRKQLLSGRPTTDDGVKDEIRNGGPGMAAYKYTLGDADLNDLVAYLRNGCCWDSNRTPPNPRYRFSEEKE